jgi:hypothetical protein
MVAGRVPRLTSRSFRILAFERIFPRGEMRQGVRQRDNTWSPRCTRGGRTRRSRSPERVVFRTPSAALLVKSIRPASRRRRPRVRPPAQAHTGARGGMRAGGCAPRIHRGGLRRARRQPPRAFARRGRRPLSGRPTSAARCSQLAGRTGGIVGPPAHPPRAGALPFSACISPPPNRLGWVFAHPPSSPYAAAAQRSRADGERRRAQGAGRGAGTGGGLDNGAEKALAEPGEKARGAALARARHRLGEDAHEAVGYLAGRAGKDAVGQAAAVGRREGNRH